MGVSVDPLTQALLEPALPREVVNAESAHVFAETEIKLAQQKTRVFDMPLDAAVLELL